MADKPTESGQEGVSVERQTLFWIRDQLYRCVSSTVSITPREASKLAAEIDAVLNSEPTGRGSRVRF